MIEPSLYYDRSWSSDLALSAKLLREVSESILSVRDPAEGSMDDRVVTNRLPGELSFTPLVPPSIIAVAAGRIRLSLGDRNFDLESPDVLVTSAPLPLLSSPLPGSASSCTAILAGIDVALVRNLVASTSIKRTNPSELTLITQESPSLALVRCLVRSVNGGTKTLSDEVDELKKELSLQILSTDAGYALRETLSEGTPAFRVAKAIAFIDDSYQKPLRISELAEFVEMGVSSLHHHFRQLTLMSPLQFQKRVRLKHAKNLLLQSGIQAGQAARRVGYASHNQFSREYHRLYGVSPISSVRSR